MESNNQSYGHAIDHEYREQTEEEKSQIDNESELRNQAVSEYKSSDENVTIEHLQIGENLRKDNLSNYIIELSNLASMRREIGTCYCIFSRKLRSKIKQIMGLKSTEILTSIILHKILSDAVTFDNRHSRLIKLLIDALKYLGKPNTPEFRLDNEAKILRKIIIDFLF